MGKDVKLIQPCIFSGGEITNQYSTLKNFNKTAIVRVLGDYDTQHEFYTKYTSAILLLGQREETMTTKLCRHILTNQYG